MPTIEKALMLGAIIQALDTNDGRFVFVWFTGESDKHDLESAMGFDTVIECARDAIAEIEHERARAS